VKAFSRGGREQFLHHHDIAFIENGWLFFLGGAVIRTPPAILPGRLAGR